jgi:hypothetical protein
MPDRRVYVRFHLDTNRINARQSLRTINRLEKWADDEVIDIEMSEVAHTEAREGSNASRTRKALTHIYSMTLATTAEEQRRLSQILDILAPGGAPDANTRKDAEIVFNAGKYGSILVTADGVILRNRDALSTLGVRIMSDEEAVSHVEVKVRQRDEIARMVAQKTGKRRLPEWVGND